MIFLWVKINIFLAYLRVRYFIIIILKEVESKLKSLRVWVYSGEHTCWILSSYVFIICDWHHQISVILKRMSDDNFLNKMLMCLIGKKRERDLQSAVCSFHTPILWNYTVTGWLYYCKSSCIVPIKLHFVNYLLMRVWFVVHPKAPRMRDCSVA